MFCEPETIHCKKVEKYVLSTITLYSEDDNHKEVNINEETLTFTIQLMIKIWTIKWVFKKLKRIVLVLVKNAILGQKILLVRYLLENTGREYKLLVGLCVLCIRKKSMILSDNTRQLERLGSFFKNLGKLSAKAGKVIATNALTNPGRFLEIGANVATAAAIEILKQLYQTYL